MGYKIPMTSQPIRQPLRVLGIDPGLRRTGWGVIEIDGNRLVVPSELGSSTALLAMTA